MILRAFTAALLLMGSLAAQAQTDVVPVSTSPATDTVQLTRDTPVILMAVKEVSTADAVPGTRFKLRVNEPVILHGRTIIPVGTSAFGTVVSAVDSGGLGKSGRMTAKLLYIQLGDTMIPLEGEMSAQGTGAGSAGVAVLFTGVAGLFHRGNNAKIKAGELLTGFVAQDFTIDIPANAGSEASLPATSPVPAHP